MASSSPSLSSSTTTTTRKRKRVILFNGWLRTYTYPRLWMKPLAEHLRATSYEGTDVAVAGNTIPAQTNDIEKYVRHLAALVGPEGPDEDTYFIGQSVGCQVILRYLSQLPPGSKVGGFLSVGCWLYLDYTTKRRRSTAIDELIQDEWEGFQRWMDYTNVDFENVRRVCSNGNLVALMSNDDPYRGLDDGGECNKQDWEGVVGARVVMRRGKGHFNCLKLDAEDLTFVENFLGLARRPPEALVPQADDEKEAGRKLKRGQFRSRL